MQSSETIYLKRPTVRGRDPKSKQPAVPVVPKKPREPRKPTAPKCQDGRARNEKFALQKKCITEAMVKKLEPMVAKLLIKANAKKRADYNKANPKPRKKKAIK